MAKKRGTRITISGQRVEALLEIGEEMLEEFNARNEHQFLLREYLLDLVQNLRDLLKRQQQEYLLVLNGPESIAFYQLWHMLDISHDKYAALIVDNLLSKMGTLAA